MKKFTFETYVMVPVSAEIVADNIEAAKTILTTKPNISVLSSTKTTWMITGEPVVIPVKPNPQVVELPDEVTYYVEGVASVPVFTRIKAASLEEAKKKALLDIGIIYEPSPDGREDLEEYYWVAPSIDTPVRPLYFTKEETTNA